MATLQQEEALRILQDQEIALREANQGEVLLQPEEILMAILLREVQIKRQDPQEVDLQEVVQAEVVHREVPLLEVHLQAEEEGTKTLFN